MSTPKILPAGPFSIPIDGPSAERTYSADQGLYHFHFIEADRADGVESRVEISGKVLSEDSFIAERIEFLHDGGPLEFTFSADDGTTLQNGDAIPISSTRIITGELEVNFDDYFRGVFIQVAEMTTDQQVEWLYDRAGIEADPEGLAFWTDVAETRGIEFVEDFFTL